VDWEQKNLAQCFWGDEIPKHRYSRLLYGSKSGTAFFNLIFLLASITLYIVTGFIVIFPHGHIMYGKCVYIS
jgi:hypothetical protein